MTSTVTDASLPWTEAPFSPLRLLAALDLAAERAEQLGPGIYRVWGGEEEHWVNLEDRTAPLCDCGDHTHREVLCKHGLAAMLLIGHPRAMYGLPIAIRQAWLARRLVVQVFQRPLGDPLAPSLAPILAG
jgi:hypothetical protein